MRSGFASLLSRKQQALKHSRRLRKETTATQLCYAVAGAGRIAHQGMSRKFVNLAVRKPSGTTEVGNRQ